MPAGLTQVSRCRPHVRSRIDTGFYSEIPMHRGLVERMELAGDYSVELSLSGDVFDGFAVCEGRLVTAWLRLQSEAVPVAVLDAVLLSSGDGKRYSLADACDLVSEALQKAVQELVWTCRNDFSAVLEAGSVLFIRRLEVRDEFRSSQLSQNIVDAACVWLTSKCRLALLTLKPFPLQYENIEPVLGSRHYEAYCRGLREDLEKLSLYYSYHFGCLAASLESTLLIKPLNGHRCALSRAGWSFIAAE